jgi:membrane-bound inhibitor of C-type lysozyme
MRTMRWMLVAAAVVGLASSAEAQRFVAYECNDGAKFQAAVLDRDKVAYVQLDGHAYKLPKKIAYTGSRYAQGGVTYWVRGNGSVTIKRAGKTTECFSISTN